MHRRWGLHHVLWTRKPGPCGKEGIQQAKKSLEIRERIGDRKGQTSCLDSLAWLFFDDKQLDAAENATFRAIDLTAEIGEEFSACNFHRILGDIYHAKGEREQAIHHFETALEIASPFHWDDPLFGINSSLAIVSADARGFNEASAYIEKAKLHAIGDGYKLGRATEMQATVLYRQSKLEDAKSDVLSAIEIYEKLGATKDVGDCIKLLRMVEEAM